LRGKGDEQEPPPKWTSELTNYLEKSGKNTVGTALLVDGPNENKGSSIRLSRILDNDDGETVDKWTASRSTYQGPAIKACMDRFRATRSTYPRNQADYVCRRK
jgi:hypothetical protein